MPIEKIFSYNFQFSRLPFTNKRILELSNWIFRFDRYWSSAVLIPFCFIPQILRSSIINHWKWKLFLSLWKSINHIINEVYGCELFIFCKHEIKSFSLTLSAHCSPLEIGLVQRTLKKPGLLLFASSCCQPVDASHPAMWPKGVTRFIYQVAVSTPEYAYSSLLPLQPIYFQSHV